MPLRVKGGATAAPVSLVRNCGAFRDSRCPRLIVFSAAVSAGQAQGPEVGEGSGAGTKPADFHIPAS